MAVYVPCKVYANDNNDETGKEIVNIEFSRNGDVSIKKNTHGWKIVDDDGNEYWRYEYGFIEDEIICGGVVTVTYSDGSNDSYCLKYQTMGLDDDHMWYESVDGELIPLGFNTTCYTVQNENHWTVGTHYFDIIINDEYSFSIPVGIVETDINSADLDINLHINENTHGNYTTDSEGNKYFCYDRPSWSLWNGSVLTVYKTIDGVDVTEKYTYDSYIYNFLDLNGNVIPYTWDVDVYTYQADDHWFPNKKNYFTFNIDGIILDVPVTIDSSAPAEQKDISSIKYKLSKSETDIKGRKYDGMTGEYIPNCFYPEEGDSITIYYDDMTYKTYEYNSMLDKFETSYETFVEGEYFYTDELTFTDVSNKGDWVVGESYDYEIDYNGFKDTVTLTIVGEEVSNWYDDYEYELVNGKIRLTQYIGNDTDIYVPKSAVINGIEYQTELSSIHYMANPTWEEQSAIWNKLSDNVSGPITVDSDIESIMFEDGFVFPQDSSGIFAQMRKLENVDLRGVNTKSVQNMAKMFQNCSSLQQIDVSSFDTSKVTNMSYMFYSCESLAELNLNNFVTDNVTDLNNMFLGCKGLEELNLKSFNTSKVTNMGKMFCSCDGLKKLNVSSFDTSNVTDMGMMFNYCTGLQELDVSGFNTSKVTSMAGMFGGCSSLKTLDVSSFDTRNVVSQKAGSGYGMFLGCKELTELDLSNFDTRNITDFSFMFSGCTKLKSINISSFDVSNSVYFRGMFWECKNLENLDLSCFKTSKLGASDILYPYMIQDIFAGCSSLKILDISNFDFNNLDDHFAELFGNDEYFMLFEHYIKDCIPDIIIAPSGIDKKIQLPCDYYDKNGIKYNYFPMNTSSKITLSQNKPIEINSDNFPDNAFIYAVRQQLDLDKNNVLSEEEIQKATKIDIYNSSSLASVKGVELFPELKELNIPNNVVGETTRLTQLDLSNNKKLEIINCSGSTLLTKIDLTQNELLKELYCSGTGLTNLDISNNINLEKLYCNGTGIDEINLDNNKLLKEINCSDTKITTLNLENNVELTKIGCSNTGITSLNLNNNSKLTSLNCAGTQITNLNLNNNRSLKQIYMNDCPIGDYDFSGLDELYELYCRNCGMTNIDLSNNKKLTFAECEQNQKCVLSVYFNREIEGLPDVHFDDSTEIRIFDGINWLDQEAEGDLKDNDGARWHFSFKDYKLTLSGDRIAFTPRYAILHPQWGCALYPRSVILCEGVSVIGEYVFRNMNNVTSIEIPSTVTKIEKYAFYAAREDSYSKLKDIYYHGTKADWDKIEFGEMYNFSFDDVIIHYLDEIDGLHEGTDGKLYYYKNGTIDTTFTGFVKYKSDIWYVSKGVVSYTTDIVKNSADGNWYYIKGGKQDLTFTGFATNKNGTYYCQNGIVQFITSIVKNPKDGKWYYINNGKQDLKFTGFAKNANGTFYCKNGVVQFITSIEKNPKDGKWYYINNGKQDITFTGFAKNANGTFYCQKGVVQFITSIVKNPKDGKWYYINNGKQDLTFTGFAKNVNGTYYCQNGIVQFITSIVKNPKDGKWYYINNGKQDLKFTGFAKNANGTFYCQNGIVQFITSIVKNPKDGKWYYISNGKQNLTFTGIAKNSNGSFLVQKGIVNFNYSGKYTYNGKTYTIKNGKVI